MRFTHLPERQGLYDPGYEKDSCGVGFVADVKGTKTNKTVKQGLEILNRMVHRGAVGADPLTGDGAGILIQMPHAFFKAVMADAKITLPEYGFYGTGLVFFPTDAAERKICKDIFEATVKEKGLELLGWRKVPVDSQQIGATARESEPEIEQIVIKRSADCKEQIDLERKLYVIRKLAENRIAKKQLKQATFFYVVGLSSRTFGYKGLLMPEQVGAFFKDLQDDRLLSAIALVHSRFSTNTFPTWDLAQPFRFLAHNGEINTLRGNVNWLRAKEGQLQSAYFTPGELDEMKPIIRPNGSDTAMLDNVFELLCLSGRSLQHTMMMLVPAAWENDVEMKEELKDFYRFHASFMEPWDGPAALAFTDGTTIAATLDRNGLRPAKYLETKDGMVVLASEHGVLDIANENIKYSGRIEPGKVLLIDTVQGKILGDTEVKESLYDAHSYGEWVTKGMLHINDLSEQAAIPAKVEDVTKAMKVFGYTREDTKMIVKVMAETGKEPIGSMGNDAPPAVLSKKPQLMYTYFKQLFAQVTNPAIDPIREEIVMSLRSYIGVKRNILAESADHCKMLVVDRPVLLNEELAKIKALENKGQKYAVISLLFAANDPKAFDAALVRLEKEADAAVKNGAAYIILSDRGVDAKNAAVPALVAVGLVHHYLVKNANRSQISIVLESGEPREVHHFAVLFGYGVDLINPYLVYEVMEKMIGENEIEGVKIDAAIDNYRHSLEAGVLKVLSKIGISTLQSYRGAQIFEALGVHEEVIERAFVGTPSRIGGVKFAQIAGETLARHSEAYPANSDLESEILKSGGFYHWRKDGENHLWNPESIAAIQDATRKNDRNRYNDFAKLINDQSAQPTTLRSLFTFKPTKSIPLDQVESKEAIFKRFVTGAMSFGSISRGAHETLAVAMNRIHGMSNTGEGGEDPARFQPLPNGDSKRSAIKQVASGRFGVSANYLANADEIQIKVSQGAKPGEGGQLPGHKVSVTIAATRFTTPGVTLISPPPHHDIYSIEDLAQLIYDLKNANPKARISVKLVSEVGVGTIAAGVAKGHADMILISGGDGGTGASPISSIKHAGMPWELGLSETHQTLVLNDLRSRVRLQTDGQMRTGRDVAIAAILGAEEYGFCTAALIVMGCVMLRHCHLNNCSVGVATQDPILERKFNGRAEWVINFMTFVAEELREIMAQLGVKTIDELVGRTDLLEVNTAIVPEKAKNIDFSKLLFKPVVPANVGIYRTKMQDHGLEKALDWKLVKEAKDALEHGKKVSITSTICNVNRSAGTILSYHVASRYGSEGLPEDTIHVKFTGVTGQSFGAFISPGITFEHEGLANDYVGKGISGGKIIIYPNRKTDFKAEDNFIIGNTTFYGAIKGEAYIRGKAGERFCIRNSGLMGVVEGVGDHGCEYMTGGTIVILGKTGRNFAAGMSGGAAYVYDEDGMFHKRCNMEMVKIEELESEDIATIQTLLHDHLAYTKSPKAKMVLDSFDAEIKKFRKVMPVEYKRILEQKKLEEKMGLANAA